MVLSGMPEVDVRYVTTRSNAAEADGVLASKVTVLVVAFYAKSYQCIYGLWQFARVAHVGERRLLLWLRL